MNGTLLGFCKCVQNPNVLSLAGNCFQLACCTSSQRGNEQSDIVKVTMSSPMPRLKLQDPGSKESRMFFNLALASARCSLVLALFTKLQSKTCCCSSGRGHAWRYLLRSCSETRPASFVASFRGRRYKDLLGWSGWRKWNLWSWQLWHRCSGWDCLSKKTFASVETTIYARFHHCARAPGTTVWIQSLPTPTTWRAGRPILWNRPRHISREKVHCNGKRRSNWCSQSRLCSDFWELLNIHCTHVRGHPHVAPRCCESHPVGLGVALPSSQVRLVHWLKDTLWLQILTLINFVWCIWAASCLVPQVSWVSVSLATHLSNPKKCLW